MHIEKDTAEITPAAIEHLIKYATEAHPLEACGLLVSSGIGDPIDEIVPIRNSSKQAHHRFAFDPQDWVQAYFNAQKNQRHLVGFFHSHPMGAPVPSPTDYAGLPPAFAGIYCIVSVCTHPPQIQMYRGQAGELHPLMLAEVSV
ncbi:Mov34/MPN/PAD-1 family protein [Paenibacillus daejeonensis]|uniref:Mov34/MPN/PAD-1 family protein n=1 Tax=Paenibacillus daejeonensis TaxID=135193 RepID=UPI00037A9A57|nr:M67 family metallopeptidase [Paenibacillus daejeonensis]